MRITFGALIIALAATASLEAQVLRDLSIRELVELARIERERRTAAPKPAEGRVYTTEDLQRFVPSVPEAQGVLAEAGEPQPDGEPVGGETPADAAEGELPDTEPEGEASDIVLIAWLEMVNETQAEIQELEDQEVRQQLAMTDIESLVTGPIGTQQERNQARVELAAAQAELARIREELDRARADLAALEARQPELP